MLARPARWFVVPILLLAMAVGALPAPAHEPDTIPLKETEQPAKAPFFVDEKGWQPGGPAVDELSLWDMNLAAFDNGGISGGSWITCGLTTGGMEGEDTYATSCDLTVKVTTTRRIKNILGLPSRVIYEDKVNPETIMPTYTTYSSANRRPRGLQRYWAASVHFHYDMQLTPRMRRLLAPVMTLKNMKITGFATGPASHGSPVFHLEPGDERGMFTRPSSSAPWCATRDPNLWIRGRSSGKACPDGPATAGWYRG